MDPARLDNSLVRRATRHGVSASWYGAVIFLRWSRLGSNQRPSACEADALPLSHGTGAERRTTSNTSTLEAGVMRARWGWKRREVGLTRPVPRDLCGPVHLDYRRASHRATISSVARGCSAVGSASPCQGEGRGFESRHPLEGARGINPAVEWPSGEATACKAVHTGSIPVSTSKIRSPSAISSAGERFPDTEEVTGSIPVSRTRVIAVQAQHNIRGLGLNVGYRAITAPVKPHADQVGLRETLPSKPV